VAAEAAVKAAADAADSEDRNYLAAWRLRKEGNAEERVAAVAAMATARAAQKQQEQECMATVAAEFKRKAAVEVAAAAAAAKKELLNKAAAALAARRMAKAKEPSAKDPPSSKELAEQALWNEMYEEVSLGGITYLRHRSMGLIFVKGEGVRELGDEMPEWDEDLGEFKAY
jgi:hypothetical protein